MRRIDRIIVHCTATNQNCTITQLLHDFTSRGWKTPGYHYIVEADGKITQLVDESHVSNGVKGYNATSINIAYMGGVDKHKRGIDNRTDAQREALQNKLRDLHIKYPYAKIMGHRDLSPDLNHDGVIEPSEWIKMCPCFNAIDEYKDI